MNIVIIGAGNVATVLAQCFVAKNHTIIQIINRDKIKGEALAYKVQAKNFNTTLQSIQQGADFYVLAVSDNAIANIAHNIHIKDGVLLHTAGSVDVQVLKPAAKQYGVLYPLQSLSASTTLIPDIPFLVEGSEHIIEQTIYKWATTFSNTVQLADSNARLQAHLAAVFVSNFTNYLYTLTDEYCAVNNIDFSLLFPLIEETATRLKNITPSALQTGPAVRDDKETIQKHQQLLQQYPTLLRIYNIMTESIQKSYNP